MKSAKRSSTTKFAKREERECETLESNTFNWQNYSHFENFTTSGTTSTAGESTPLLFSADVSPKGQMSSQEDHNSNTFMENRDSKKRDEFPSFTAWKDKEENSDELSAKLILEMDPQEKEDKGKWKKFRQKRASRTLLPKFLPFFREPQPRIVNFPGLIPLRKTKFVSNAVNNRKYGVIMFVPNIMYEQFRMFINMYYLLLNLTQLFEIFKIGMFYTYYGPLIFIIFVKMSTELYNETKIWKKDSELNSQKYEKLTPDGIILVKSADIRVGDIILINKGQRAPADLIILKNYDGASCFIKTDQLDGETDWKVRMPVTYTQNLPEEWLLMQIEGFLNVEAPKKDIYNFVGNMYVSREGEDLDEPLSLENTIWHNTILASGKVIAIVIYTGKDTRASMNQNASKTKIGVFDDEVNYFCKPLALILFAISVCLLYFGGSKKWYLIIRFVILLSSMIPMSIRVNLDLARIFYTLRLTNDPTIRGAVVRNGNILEELGRIDYLLTDKTGTLTRNEMELKRLSTCLRSYGESSENVIKEIIDIESKKHLTETHYHKYREKQKVIYNLLLAFSLCNSVIPVISEEKTLSYKSPSPDEIAIVEWARKSGIELFYRDLTSIHLKIIDGSLLKFTILNIFPFSSALKRMGIVLKDLQTNEIIFYCKGADNVMSNIIVHEDWLQEECDNLSREGLRTLVFARKVISHEDYQIFSDNYQAARCLMTNRYAVMEKFVFRCLENKMELLGISGVEDKLQDNVRITIESLRSANIKIWMLTGDKIETATCVATSSRLINRDQNFYILTNITEIVSAESELSNLAGQSSSCLVIDGQSLDVFLKYFDKEFIKLAMLFPSAVFCRCSPTQKAQITNLIKKKSKKRVCAIGDGGNDVSMIKTAHYGIGIEGKEGNHAAFTSDISIKEFSHISLLILWAGRLYYKRSAKLILLIIHKGLLISFVQVFFTIVFNMTSERLFSGMMQLLYTAIYNTLPTFSIITDRDISDEFALIYPELYTDLRKGRSFSWLTFIQWIAKSIFQGGIIILITFYVYETDLFKANLLTFFATVTVQISTVAIEIICWNKYMVASNVITILLMCLCSVVFRSIFDIRYLFSIEFFSKMLSLVAVSIAPLLVIKFTYRYINPPNYSKLS